MEKFISFFGEGTINSNTAPVEILRLIGCPARLCEAVDRYRRGHKHCVLISLREAKRRGDILNISIDRTVCNGFAVTTGWSETTVQHRTHRLKLAIIFPAKRLPKSVTLLQVNQNRSIRLGPSNTEFLSRGRQRITWQTTKPKLFETYTLTWTW